MAAIKSMTEYRPDDLDKLEMMGEFYSAMKKTHEAGIAEKQKVEIIKVAVGKLEKKKFLTPEQAQTVLNKLLQDKGYKCSNCD